MTDACPACAVLPPPAPAADARPAAHVYHVAVPGMHCAGCMGTVERGLAGLPGVASARVNLSRKRVTVSAEHDDMEPAILARLESLGYPGQPLDSAQIQKAADPTGRALLLRLGIAGFAAMNVMLLSVAVWSGAVGETRTFLHWISASIALPAALFAAQPFFANAWAAAKAWRMVMDTPISVAILLALGVSLYETALGGAHAYFDAALSLTFFLLLGRVLDHHSRAAARSAAADLAALELPRAERLGAAGPQTVALEALSPGDTVLVRPGGRIPVDGEIAVGVSEIDRSLLTGESMPVAAGEGDEVHAGEINLSGPLQVTVRAVGADTQLRRIADLVRAAEGTRNRYVALADRAAQVYAPVVHLLALVAGVAWYASTGDLRLAVNIATAVLIITCPCALGLAVPSVMIAASGALFRRGVLLKDGTALERLAGADVAVLDKTGTLTGALPGPVEPGRHGKRALAIAGALGAASAHPLARALAAAAEGLVVPALSDLREHPGQGIEGRLDGTPVRLGRADWVGAEADGAGTATWLKIGDEPPLRFDFADQPKPGAAEMVAGLGRRMREVLLLSGDAPAPVARLAASLGIRDHRAGVTPQDKAAVLGELQAEGHRVLMVGDGLNDTAALAMADVSMAPAGGLDVARSAADIVLMNEDLSVAPQVVDIARRARRRMLENFGLAAAYNAVAIPLAVAGYATPLMAALAMSASSICVSLNALRVR